MDLFLFDFFSEQAITVWRMAVRMVKAGLYDSIFGSDYHSDSKKLLARINIFTGMTPKDLAKVAKWPCWNPICFFLCPSGTLNILVCVVSYLLLLWISGLCCGHLLLLWISWFTLWIFWFHFVLWVICYCCDSCGPLYVKLVNFNTIWLSWEMTDFSLFENGCM